MPRWARRSPQPPLLSCGTGAVLGVPEVLPLGIPAPTAPLSQGNAEGTVPTPGWVLRKGRGGAPVPISPTHALGEHKPRRCFKVGDFLRWGGGWVKPSGSTLCEGKAALTPHLESSDWFRKVAPRAGQGRAGLPPHPHLGSRPTAKVAKTRNSTSLLLFRLCFPAGQSRDDLLLFPSFPKGISSPARPAPGEGGHLWGRLDSAWPLPGAFLGNDTASWHLPGSSHLQALGNLCLQRSAHPQSRRICYFVFLSQQ